MQSLLLLLATLALLLPAAAGTPRVMTGLEVLRESGFAALKGKRVGLITNPTGVDSRVRSTIDILHHAPGVALVALFGPEHGVRGDHAAGDRVMSYTDESSGLPVYSLYGRTRKPTPEMLKGIDALVYDIQDIGCRSYTYISTMGLAMEAASEAGIEFVVLDRPNPLGGERIEGNPVEPGSESFVSAFPIPYVYGLTCGELARMINGEGWLSGRARCRLTVIPMRGWHRRMSFTETGLPWVPTSPHIPESTSPAYYVCSGLLGELGEMSEGVGYTIPFQTFAAPGIPQQRLADSLNALGLPGILFRPIVFKPFYGKYRDTELRGVQVHFTDLSAVDLIGVQFRVMEALATIAPEKNPLVTADSSRKTMFDKVTGSPEVRRRFMQRMKYADVKEYLRKGKEEYKGKAAAYLLYPSAAPGNPQRD
jgi:uncharacterized protein YbbC (DUF1343 family)